MYFDEDFKKALDLYESTYYWKEMSNSLAKMLKESNDDVKGDGKDDESVKVFIELKHLQTLVD